MYAIIKDNTQVYTFDEKPKFQRGVLAYPLKAFDIIEGVVEVIEFEDTAKPEPTTELKEVFRDGIVDGLQVWNERNMFATVEEEEAYLEAKFKATVPTSISPVQLRLTLLSAGLLDELEAMVAADRAMAIWLEYALEIKRDNEFVISFGTALGLTERQIDEMFIAAKEL